jgi:hypothetical protein
MELREALAHISEIRAQIARTETFRGYRSATVATTGVAAIVGSLVQAAWIPAPLESAGAYLGLWLGIAAGGILLCGGEMAWRSYRTDSPLARQLTLLAVEQFLPCVVAGGLLTVTVVRYAPESLWMLPGLWPVVFSLGVFASCRLLPRALFWVGVYYLAAGMVVFVLARGEAALSPWAMAATFGVGQLASAAILYFALERNHGPS